MEIREVFVVGDSLYAETLIQILNDSQTVSVIGTAASPQDALTVLKSKAPDAVIVAVADDSAVTDFTPIIISYPDLPIIHADLNTDHVQLITNLSIDAHVNDLLAAIAGLPKRDLNIDNKQSTDSRKPD